MTESTGDDLVSLKCPEPDCDYETTLLPENGQGSAKMRLGQHGYVKHGKKGAGRTPRGKAAQNRQDLADRPALTIINSAAREVSGKGKPSATALERGLGEALSLTTIAAASYLAETDPNIADGPQGEQDRDDVVQYLTLPPDAANNVMRPIAKVLAPTKVNAKYGRAIVDNVEVVSSVIDLGRLFMHYRHYMTTRNQTRTGARSMAAPLGAAPVIADMGAGVPAGSAPHAGASPLSAGHVMTPAEVEALRQRRGMG